MPFDPNSPDVQNRVEQLESILSNARAIHGDNFAEYLKFHLKSHQFNFLFDKSLEALNKLCNCEDDEEAKVAHKFFDSCVTATITCVLSMDEQMAHALGMNKELVMEACNLANTMTEVSIHKTTQKDDRG